MSTLKLDPVTDEAGNVIETEDVISRALAPEKITFSFGGFNYMAWICKTQIPGRLLNRVNAINGKIALGIGFQEGEEILPDDPRTLRFMELLAENPVLEAVEADIAVAATVKENGKPLTSIPMPKDLKEFDRDTLLSLGGIGSAYAEAVSKALRPTSPAPVPGAAATPKTRKAKPTAS